MQCWMKFVPVKKGRISIDTWRSSLQLPLLSKIEMRVHLEAELSRAQSASSGLPSVRKFRYYTHPRKYGYDVSVLCPSVHSLGMREGNQVSTLQGEEYDIFFLPGNRAMHLTRAFFLAGNRARNGATIVVAAKNLFTLGNCF